MSIVYCCRYGSALSGSGPAAEDFEVVGNRVGVFDQIPRVTGPDGVTISAEKQGLRIEGNSIADAMGETLGLSPRELNPPA